MQIFLGIDVGSVSTNLAALDLYGQVIDTLYIRTNGKPIDAVKSGLKKFHDDHPEFAISAVGTTGSGRQLASLIVGADSVKNEITAHAVAAIKLVPGTQTILEIGGQDSKIIIIKDGIVVDFAMNTVCAAGTGSFLDQQAARLNLPIEKFGERAMEATATVRIAGRCAVFAESDMIHKQQAGYSISDVINGLCQALVRNYLNNVGKGKDIREKVIFQGGVAANQGMKKAFEEALGCPVIIPPHYNVMGAIGAALLAGNKVKTQEKTNFRGFELLDYDYSPRSFDCSGCANNCEIVEMRINGEIAARWGDRCGKWSGAMLTTSGGKESIG